MAKCIAVFSMSPLSQVASSRFVRRLDFIRLQRPEVEIGGWAIPRSFAPAMIFSRPSMPPVPPQSHLEAGAYARQGGRNGANVTGNAYSRSQNTPAVCAGQDRTRRGTSRSTSAASSRSRWSSPGTMPAAGGAGAVDDVALGLRNRPRGRPSGVPCRAAAGFGVTPDAPILWPAPQPLAHFARKTGERALWGPKAAGRRPGEVALRLDAWSSRIKSRRMVSKCESSACFPAALPRLHRECRDAICRGNALERLQQRAVARSMLYWGL
jgi:hypothetical protein